MNNSASQVSYAIGYIVSLIVLMFVAMGIQSWALQVVLSWFSVELSFLQCAGIVFFAHSFRSFGVVKFSEKNQ
jgi:hypothetical protein